MTGSAGLEIERDVPLAGLTSLGVGGAAERLVRPVGETRLIEAIALARAQGWPLWVLGGGSNVVVADSGLPGLVIVPAGRRRRAALVDDRHMRVDVEAGHDWDELVEWTVAGQLAGLECLSGIPGRVGAAPIQNIGAYGQELADTCIEVRVIDSATGIAASWDLSRLRFGYRESALKRASIGSFVVTEISLLLRRHGRATVRYGELADRLRVDGYGDPAPLAAARAAVLAIRKTKAMVIDRRDTDSRSAGSFFVNPTVADAVADQVAERLGGGVTRTDGAGTTTDGAAKRADGAGTTGMPRYPRGDGQVKLSAAWLIERCGMTKGYGEGPVGLSGKHALALINRGGAKASDVLAFARHVRDRVASGSDVVLEPEPRWLGFGAEFSF